MDSRDDWACFFCLWLTILTNGGVCFLRCFRFSFLDERHSPQFSHKMWTEVVYARYFCIADEETDDEILFINQLFMKNSASILSPPVIILFVKEFHFHVFQFYFQ